MLGGKYMKSPIPYKIIDSGQCIEEKTPYNMVTNASP